MTNFGNESKMPWHVLVQKSGVMRCFGKISTVVLVCFGKRGRMPRPILVKKSSKPWRILVKTVPCYNRFVLTAICVDRPCSRQKYAMTDFCKEINMPKHVFVKIKTVDIICH